MISVMKGVLENHLGRQGLRQGQHRCEQEPVPMREPQGL